MTSLRALSLAAALCGPAAAAAGAAEPVETPQSPIERAALDAAARRVAPPDRFEPQSCRIEAGDPVPAGAVLEVLETVGPDAGGTVKIRFRTLAAAGPAGEVRAVVHGRVRGPALVARRALTGGSAIDGTALEVADADLTRLEEPPLRDAAQAAGLVPRYTIGVGRALTPGLLAPLPVVHRGDTLDLRIERGRLLVRTVGIAGEDGAAGDLVTARNSATGAFVVARVQPDGSLLVLRSSDTTRSRR